MAGLRSSYPDHRGRRCSRRIHDLDTTGRNHPVAITVRKVAKLTRDRIQAQRQALEPAGEITASRQGEGVLKHGEEQGEVIRV